MMLITSRFVVLNFPKTGSSFVREVLKTIHRRRRWRWGADRFLKELMLPRAFETDKSNPLGIGSRLDQHGTLRQTPERYRRLPVVSVARNPYARLLSMFEFKWWQTHPPLPREELQTFLPHFPDLSLDDFVTMSERIAARAVGGENPARLGRQTVQFVRFYFKDPQTVLSKISDDYVESGAFRADMGEVTFLRQHDLNHDLADYLQRHGYSAAEADLCRTYPRVNRTDGGVADRRTLWTPRAASYVATNERYLLGMLEQLGVGCAPPAGARQRGSVAA
jgi:hypothetical protein